MYDPHPPRVWQRADFENTPLPPPPDPSVFEAIDHVQAELGNDRYVAGTPADVRRDVRAAMEKGAPSGGFILGPSHSVPKNTPYANFMAMLDAFVARRDGV